MHLWFLTIHTQVFSNVRTIQEKICLDDVRAKCLKKDSNG